MKFVHPYKDREANMVLIEAVRGGKALIKVEAPVIVFDENGEYSQEIRTTYWVLKRFGCRTVDALTPEVGFCVRDKCA